MQEKLETTRFLKALNLLETGHHTGCLSGRRYGVSVERPMKTRITKLFARELGGSDLISFNLFQVGKNRHILKPCEMPQEKVIAFVLQFIPDKTK